MEMNLKEKTAIVTGGSEGIGLAIATALKQEGANVVIVSRNRNEAVAELEKSGLVCHIAADLTESGAELEVVDKTLATFDSIDILVNNLGGIENGRARGFLETRDEEWHSLYELNLFSLVRMCKAVIPHLLNDGGSIIHISSVNAVQPNPMIPIYSTTKAALNNLTKVMSEEFAPQGIRTNAVSPGPVDTPLWGREGGLAATVANATGIPYEEVMDQLPQLAGLSINRVVAPEEVASLVLYLASPLSAAVTGAIFTIDGGMTKAL